jgi:hypothetical protein
MEGRVAPNQPPSRHHHHALRYKGEATAHRQNNYELVRTKDTALADAQRATQEAKSKLASMELKFEKLERENTNLGTQTKEGAVTKEKLRAETQRSRELARRCVRASERRESAEGAPPTNYFPPLPCGAGSRSSRAGWRTSLPGSRARRATS